MNRKLKIALRHRFNHQGEQGFALPIAIGLGLAMILVGTTMVIRSQGDQVTASAQRETAQSSAIAEGGLARTLSRLNLTDNAYLLTLNYDPLNPNLNPNSPKTYLGPNQIQNDGDGETAAVNTWLTPPPVGGCPAANKSIPNGILSGSIGSEDYQLTAYRYVRNSGADGVLNTLDDIQLGALLLEGTQRDSVSRIQVSVPVRQETAANSFPGLYAGNSINLGNNNIVKVSGGTGASANVICKDCQVPSAQCSGGQPTPTGENTAVGKGPNSQIDGQVYIADPNLPPVPTPPPNTTCSSTGSACRINLGGTTLLLPGPLNIGTTPILPRPTDILSHKAGTPYHYVMTNMPIGNNTLVINTILNALTNPSGDPVHLHVSGNITLNGTGGMLHTGSPERFVIFGNPADPTNATTDQQFTISGGSSTSNVFIFAPDASVGINGGSSDPDIQGAIWAKTWNGSSSNNVEVKVPDNMNQLVANAFGPTFDIGLQINKTGTSTSWQRLEAK